MKTWLKTFIFLLVILVVVLAWIVYFHNASIAGHLPKWGWLQSTITHLGQKTTADEPADEDPDNTQNNVPVHTAHVTVATLHRYIDGFGTIVPRPPRNGEMAGAANLASPVPGVVSKILCQVGQHVHAGEAVIQLDDRLAKSAEQQAAAALAQAKASLAALQATPRPDQLQIAQLTVSKAQSALDFAQQNYDRLKKLSAEQGASGKSVEQAAMDLAAAKTDLAISQKQLNLLKSSPTPEELRQEEAKVAQANAALVTATVQDQMMTIKAPIDATVVALFVNPGESVDVTKTLIQFVAMDRLMVDVDVPAEQLPPNALGLAAQILMSSGASTAASQPSQDASPPIIGKVSFVSPQVDPRTASVQVGIDLPADAKLKPGLTVRVRIIAEEHKDVLAVPREAVTTDENGDSVVAVVEGDQATHKTVKTGLEENGLIEIQADGVAEGTTVVTSGAFGLPAASRVKVLD